MSSGIQYIENYEAEFDAASGGLATMVDAYNTVLLPVSAAIAALYIMIQAIKIVADPGAGKVDFNTLVKPILLIASIVLYNELIGLIDSLIDVITQVYEIPSSQIDVVATAMTETQDSVAGDPDSGGIYDIVQVHWMFEFIHMCMFFFASFVGFGIMCMQFVSIKMLYLIGPLALTCSLIPGNFGALQKWISSYIAVSLWKPIYYIMMTLFEHVISMNAGGFDMADVLFTMAFQGVLIWTVAEIPTFAAFLVAADQPYSGGKGVEKVYSQGAAMGAVAAGHAGKGLKLGLGAVGGKASSLGRATGSGIKRGWRAATGGSKNSNDGGSTN